DLGAPFRAGDGRLCAWQHLRVRDVHRALELYDARFRSELADTKAAAQVRHEFGCESRVSATLWAAAIEKGARWLEETDGTLLWHVPASEGDALALMNRIEKAPALDQYLARFRAAKTSDAEKAAPQTEVERSVDATGGGDFLATLLHAFGVTTRR